MWLKGLANRITIARGMLAVAVWVLLSLPGEKGGEWLWAAFVVYLVAALSDLLDGFLARRLADTSAFGRIADPLIDKALTLGTMIVLLGNPAVHAALPAWIVAAVLVRELLVTALRGSLEGRGIPLPAVRLGKWKMVVQTTTTAAAILFPLGNTLASAPVDFLARDPGGPGRWTLTYLLSWLTLALTLISAAPYLTSSVRWRRRNEAPRV